MSDGFDEVYVDTRRQLRGVAESLIAGRAMDHASTQAGTQSRRSCRSVPDGFAR